MATGFRQHYNLEFGTLGAGLTDAETTITFNAPPGFATIGAGEYIALTLDNQEIVHMTAYTSGATTGTIERGQEGTSAIAHTAGEAWVHSATNQDLVEPFRLVVAGSDGTTVISAGTDKEKFRMPAAVTLTDIRASLSVAHSAGTFTVDVNKDGVSILSTKLTIDATETTSTTAAVPVVISDTDLTDNAEITIDVDDAGDNTAKGLKVTFIGEYK